ncbi:oligopeptide/dipeptide ABC transporter ATP-binding protein [Aureimonas ureilytica]|uniref:oligopeptide/dipeptide ABC transporter ATP-binding protein n=1 Tax=Aureimonas ureilytica TaxID=401562 RepID=UPI00037D0FB2|nr:ABC transporter ATP-binding protein [Aureimonas ureilytica]
MSAPLLSLRGLVRDYGSGLAGRGTPLRAVDGVSLQVEKGEIVGIVGESGCGKSTLARVVAALDRPTEGQVLLDGEDLFTMDKRALLRRRDRFQMVFQDPYGSLDPRRRIGWSVAEPLGVLAPRLSKAETERRVAEMLEAVGLKAADAKRFPHEFSGGQRQRVAIARALVTRPDLVIADEAVSALDLSVQAQVLNLILDLRERTGVAFLFITHNLSVVDAICDRVAVMYRGRIVESGATRAVFDAPRHPYTRLLLAAEPGREASAPQAAGAVPPFPEDAADWNGCAFRPRCVAATEICRREAPVSAPVSAPSEPDWVVACHHGRDGVRTALAQTDAVPRF